MNERDLTAAGREAQARAMAQHFLDKTEGDSAEPLFVAQTVAERIEYLKKFAKRFAKGMAQRVLDADLPWTEEDLEFAFMELFGSFDAMKPLEKIMAFKMIGDWCGFSNIPVRALKLPQRNVPLLKFSKVGS